MGQGRKVLQDRNGDFSNRVPISQHNKRKRLETEMQEKSEVKVVAEILDDYSQHIVTKYKENLESYLQNKLETVAEEAQNYIAKLEIKDKKEVKDFNDVETGVVLKAKNHLLTPIIMRAMTKDFTGIYTEPIYAARELAIIFEYYQEMIYQLNSKGILFPPTKQNFAAFAGITSTTYDSYLKSADKNKATIMQKIEDYIIENSWTGAMTDKLNPYIVERRSKMRGIGGGYTEAKPELNINIKQEQIGTPENMMENLKLLLNDSEYKN